MHRTLENLAEIEPRDRASTHAAVPQFLRSQGEIDASFRLRGEQIAVGRSYQAGCLRMRLPRTESSNEPPCAVLMNTSGGVAEGDRLDVQIEWSENTVATVTTQAAEKVYRALATGSRISNRLTIARGASAEWLPQETILFDACRLHRDAQIVLAEDVTFLGVEAVVLGRTAMGETVRSGHLRDRMRIWRNGRLIYADTLALDGEIDGLMRQAPIGDGAKAMAVIVHAAGMAKARLDPIRDVLKEARGLAAASSWNGLLAVRLLASDGEALRHDIGLALSALRDGKPLPRVWRC